MRIVVVGGSGHIGSFLVPRLVRAGHEVVSVSRGTRAPYVDDPAWRDVRVVTTDREADDDFPGRIAALRPDVVADLICFTLDDAKALVERLRGEVGHLLHCGSIWRAGPSVRLPVTEENGEPPLGDYGIAKDAIARLLKAETGLVTTSLYPGHIVGPGWHPVGPLGNLDPAVWRTLSAGETLDTPGIGTEFLHHVHADDVAQAFQAAIARPGAAGGEDFSVVAPSALNVRGYARIAASWFGREAVLRPVSWEEFREGAGAEHAGASWEHLVRNHYFSIDKARRLLDYSPRYQPEDAILEAVRRLVERGELDVAGPLVV